MRKLLNVIGRILRYLLYLITIIIVGVTIYLLVMIRFSDDDDLWTYKAYTVLSDSMQDTFQSGDVVIIKNAEVQELSAGDIIAFYSIDPTTEGKVYTHKIREVITYNDGLAFTTYGTTTGDNDLYPATAENVIGELIYVVPDIGEYVEMAKSTQGYILVVVIPILLCLFLEIRHLIRLVKKNKETSTEEIEEIVGVAEVVEVADAGFAGGNGTVEHPFEISSQEHLALISQHLSCSFVQTQDIVLTSEFTPIGYKNDNRYYFKGNYNGNHFSIDNLKISNFGTHTGLFAATSRAKIKNINLKNINLKTKSIYTGAVAGYAVDTTVDDCVVTGEIRMINNEGASIEVGSIGGIIGYGAGVTMVSHCRFEGVIDGGTTSGNGGIAGQLINGIIKECVVSGKISGKNSVGGIVGINGPITIKDCALNMDVYALRGSGEVSEDSKSDMNATVTGCTVTGRWYNIEVNH